MRRLLAPAILSLALGGCRDVAELADQLNGELIVAHLGDGDQVSVGLDGDSFLAAQAGSEGSVRFQFRLAQGEHEGAVQVDASGAPARCGEFELEIEGVDDHDSAVVDARELNPCDAGEGEGEGEGEEGEGEGEGGEGEGEGEGEGGEGEGEGEEPACVPGDPCDDGADCTRDDRCQPTGVCAGVLSDASSCSCATSCDDAAACCVVPDNCDAEDGLCITACSDGSCECHGSVCAAALSGETLSCEDEASCRVGMSGASPSALQCREGSSCDAEIDTALIAQVDCEDARCHVDADGGGFLDVECQRTSACDLSAQDVGEVHLSCEEASCQADCRGGGCEVDCGAGADCRLECRDTDECSLTCGSDSASCELDCGSAAPCAPGSTCSCP